MMGLAEMAWRLAWQRVYGIRPVIRPEIATSLLERKNAFSGSTPAAAEYYTIIDYLESQLGWNYWDGDGNPITDVIAP
jgi:hypothetical protein